MIIGMLWSYSELKKEEYDIVEEVRKAWIYFNKKYSVVADTCYLSIGSEKVEDILDFNGNKVNIRHDRLIMPKCLWIGNEDAKELIIV
jgi:hypothetical protein